MDYIIGEKYWFKNRVAGSNTQSCGELVEVYPDGRYKMYNKRWGYITVDKKNLDEHN